MKVFCPLHEKSFLAPRRNPIKCENKAHVLGELDFDGQSLEPALPRWEYCCNCEHFWPIEADRKVGAKCPVCDRQLSARYLCDRCYTISAESPVPSKTKNFTLTPEGVPQPSCPASLESPANILREHQCDALGISFHTSLTYCPVCQELLGDAPPFPASVGEYLEKVKAYRRVTVDYENNRLVEAEGGEFALINNCAQTNQPIILPRLTHFSSRRDFYDNYQDYYVCENPSPGEVIVVYPAIVEKIEGGWRLKDVGRIEVRNEAAAAKLNESSLMPSAQEVERRGPVEEEEMDEQAEEEIACDNCGTLGSPRNTFCWHCGKPMRASASQQETPARIPVSISPETMPMLSGRADSSVIQPPVLASLSQGFNLPSNNGSRRTLFIVAGMIALTVLGLLLFLLPRVLSRTSPAEVIQDQSPKAATLESTDTTRTQPDATPAQTKTGTTRPEDDELKKIQERRGGAATSEGPGILEEITTAEKKYPEDYRFPYERAKFSITGTHAHHEAFATLFLAGQKAIGNNRTDEMLAQLMRDKDGDFNKLARGHTEWNALIEALTNKDSSALNVHPHH